MEAGFGEQQEFLGQKRRKGISGRKNSMYKGREVWKHLVCSGICGESECMCGYMGCGVRWGLTVHHIEELGQYPFKWGGSRGKGSSHVVCVL